MDIAVQVELELLTLYFAINYVCANTYILSLVILCWVFKLVGPTKRRKDTPPLLPMHTHKKEKRRKKCKG